MRAPDDEFLSAGELTLDVAGRMLIGPAGSRSIGRGVFPVLVRLMRHPGRVLETAELISVCWSDPDFEPEHAPAAVRSRVLRAREEIASVGGNPRILRSVFGVGYALGDASLRHSFRTRMAEPAGAAVGAV